jgi:hypothetical protein
MPKLGIPVIESIDFDRIDLDHIVMRLNLSVGAVVERLSIQKFLIEAVGNFNVVA